MAHDITSKDESVLDALFRLSTDFLVELDKSYSILRVNEVFCLRVGLSQESLAGTLFAKWVHHSDAVSLALSLDMTMSQGVSAEAIARTQDRHIEWRCTKTPTGLFLIGRDVSEIKSTQEKLHKLAYYDSVTNLPNRVLFQEHVEKGIQAARRKGCHAAVAFIDINKFKSINDTYGHAVGDEVIRAVADYLKNGVRSGDVVTRLGGDEFAVFMSDIRNGDDVDTIVRRLSGPIRMVVEEEQISLGLSLGVASYPAEGGDVESLLNAADSKMYCNKRNLSEVSDV